VLCLMMALVKLVQTTVSCNMKPGWPNTFGPRERLSELLSKFNRKSGM